MQLTINFTHKSQILENLGSVGISEIYFGQQRPRSNIFKDLSKQFY